ncbi:MFS transporter [Planomonospora venezuelensis]|uniref:DHA2 family multidrug resistance protein-like MFS transporter n=1 Tax=Planomonospora venezuelensis TaxID=1999 RepID=A0A841DB07_PLAVE|nr:MFS transporter [Planomonospora venezuelensis]MBB5967200.1 DHA2 family multidrug resistance protein-like MFS transporter [Planomonospora venezuelensis]GIN02969.1 quaternary ammonium compound efflux MFS transporter QacA [Planomonospora venezuelensis]
MTPTATAPPAPSTRRWAGLTVLSASLLLVVMDMTILNVALPGISAELRPGAVELLWMVDIYSLVVAGLLVTVSALGDRWGRKKMLLTGFALFGLASAAVMGADSSADVIAVRALLGVGGAMIMPSTLSMIRTLFTDARERATALGIWAAMASLGGALGPIVGGLLLESFSWHAAFLVNVPVMVVAVVAGLILLPESRNPDPGRWDAAGAVLSVVGMVALAYAIKHGAKEGLDIWTSATAAVAAVALAWFTRRCLRRSDPLLDLRLFRNGAFTSGTITALTTSIAMAAMALLLAQWMQLVQGYSPLETGVRLLPMAVGAGICSPLAPALASRIGARTVLSGGLLVSGAGFALVYLLPLGYPSVAVALLLIGAGMGALAIASAVIMSGSPAEKAGSAAAIEETSYEVGGTLGVAVLGSVAAALYRGQVPPGTPESLGTALEVAATTRDAALALQVQQAFSDSLVLTSGWGAVLMAVAAALVWWRTPAGLDLAASPH